MNVLARLFEVVDAVFVVTLEGEHERQEHTANLLHAHELDFRFHFGADFREQSIDQLARDGVYQRFARQRDGKPDLTSGEIGCAVSHRQLAEMVAKGEFNSVLVLEDDVLLIDKGLDYLIKSLEQLPEDWNLLYLGYGKNNLKIPSEIRVKLMSWYPIRYALGSQKHNPASIRRIFRRPYNKYWYRAGCFNGTHAYAIDKSAAEYLVQLQTPVQFEADAALNHLVRFSGLDAFCLRYDVFDQRWDIPSLVGPRPSWNQS